jgi:hypothetical protein
MKTSKMIILFFAVASMLMTSCKKEEEAKPASSMKKATITGHVYADLDMTEPGDEMAPAGTKIFAIINTAQFLLDPDPNVIYPFKYYEATVGTDGKYTLTFDVGNMPIQQITILGSDFWYDRKISPSITELTVYKLSPTFVGPLVPNITHIRNLKYNY